MIKNVQTHFYAGTEEGKVRGNCWQASISSILELPLEAVPHFVQFDEEVQGIDWWTYTVNWLWYRGYELFNLDRHIYTNEYYLVTGKSPRGDFYHVAVYLNGRLAHDPHPSGEGLLTEEYFNVFRQR